MANSAPASTFRSKRSISSSKFSAVGCPAQPMRNAVGSPIEFPPRSAPAFNCFKTRIKPTEVENRGRIRMVPRPRRIARQRQNVSNPERVGAHQVGLDADEIPIAAGEVGIETILHFTCRDRNLMGIQSDLMGAHALGIRNILALTGDPPRAGDYPNATAVFDVDSVGLIRVLKQLNAGTDLGGNSIGEPTAFLIGCAVNPTAENFDEEMERFERKMAAGAEFAMTQPLYELDTLVRFLNRLGSKRIPVLLGLLPLQSHRHAEFLHNEVPGINIPDYARAAMREAGEKGIEVGVEMCRKLLLEARNRWKGPI